MSDIKTGQGRCLCGSVQFSVSIIGNSVGACHCQMCRTWGAGPFMSVDCSGEMKFDSEEFICVFNSSEWAERGFCSQCGTHLFYRLKENNQYFVSVGLFEDSDHFTFDHQVFIDQKPSYYCFSNETKDMTGEEVFKAFAPSS